MAKDTGAAPQGLIRRRVYYVAGFDPASAKKHHRIFKAQSALQGALTGARYDVGELMEIDEIASGWRVVAEHPGGARVEVDYRVLNWFDLVRSMWPKDDPRLFAAFARALVAYHRCGLMKRARVDAKVVWRIAHMPVLFAAILLMLFTAASALLAWLGAGLAHRLGASWIIGAAAPLLIWLLLMPAWRWFDGLLHVGWAGKGMIGVVRAAEGRFPELADRSRAFAARLSEAACNPEVDEVLVVAHSMGGQLAARAVGRAVREDPDFGRRTPVRLLTLGSLIPFYAMTSRHTGADPAFREEMAALARADWIDWLDITGPSDPGCAASLHPLTGLDLGEPEGRPHRRSPRFSELLQPQSFARLKRSPLDYHFQYIMASERPGRYDVFRLTAGPEPILSFASLPER